MPSNSPYGAERRRAPLPPETADRRARRLRRWWTGELKKEFGFHGPPRAGMDGPTLVESLMATTSVGIVETDPDETWIWSDLHLGDEAVFARRRRPFHNLLSMDEHLLRMWERTVGDDDTIICLGGLGARSSTGWTDGPLAERLAKCPGNRVLILGPQEALNYGRLAAAGFNLLYAAAVLAADPPTVLSHKPVEAVPAGVVNLHGHSPGDAAPRRGRINLAVECTEFKPVLLETVLDRARNAIR